MAKQVKKASKGGAGAKSVSARANKRTPAKAVTVPQAKSKRPVIGSFKLTAMATATLRAFWRPLAGIMLVYAIFNLLFASGLSGIINGIRNAGGGNGKFSDAFNNFGSLLSGSSSNGAAPSSVLQAALFIIVSLAIIWALRQLLVGKQVQVKEAYYNCATPLIPFLLIFGLIILQTLPFSIGALAFSAVTGGSLVGSMLVNIIMCAFFLVLIAWSFYMLSGSLLAVYIVALPGITPIEALRSAKKLARGRRTTILRRILFLPLLLLIIFAALLIPTIFILPAGAPIIFYLLTLVAVVFSHTYLYELYRNLIS
jgi:hypothetical protein